MTEEHPHIAESEEPGAAGVDLAAPEVIERKPGFFAALLARLLAFIGTLFALPLFGMLFGLLVVLSFMPDLSPLLHGHVRALRWQGPDKHARVDVGPNYDGWVPLSKISRHLQHAAIVSEDDRFFSHPGIDVFEMWKSLQLNIERKAYARGASTITQQVVRVALLDPDKNLVRKFREILGALVIERLLTKKDILEWYFNLVAFGEGIYGVKEAARRYFYTRPELLSVEQAIHLVLVLPSPSKWSRGLRDKRLTPFGHRRFRSILNKLRASGFLTPAQWELAMASGNFGSPINAVRRRP